MKTCSVCHKEKDNSEFYQSKKHRDGLQSRCKACKKEANHQYYLNDKATYIEQARKSKQKRVERMRAVKAAMGCRCCDEKEPVCLDFHHHKDDKEITVAKAAAYSWARVEKEMKKCVVLCRNCHAKVHAGLIIVRV